MGKLGKAPNRTLVSFRRMETIKATIDLPGTFPLLVKKEEDEISRSTMSDRFLNVEDIVTMLRK